MDSKTIGYVYALPVGCGSGPIGIALPVGCGNGPIGIELTSLPVGCGSGPIGIALPVGCGSGPIGIALADVADTAKIAPRIAAESFNVLECMNLHSWPN